MAWLQEVYYIAYIPGIEATYLRDVLVSYISRYKDDIVVITRDRGGAEVKCNNNIIRVYKDITGFYPK